MERFEALVSSPRTSGLTAQSEEGAILSDLVDDTDYVFTVALDVSLSEAIHAAMFESALRIVKLELVEIHATSSSFQSQWRGSRWWPRATFTHSMSLAGTVKNSGPVHSHIRVEVPVGMTAYNARFASADPKQKYPNSTTIGSIRIAPEIVVANVGIERAHLLRVSDQDANTLAMNRNRADAIDRLIVFCRVSDSVIAPVFYALLAATSASLLFVLLELLLGTFSRLAPGSESAIASIIAVAPTLVALYAGLQVAHFKVRELIGMYLATLILAAVSLVSFAFVVATTRDHDIITSALFVALGLNSTLLLAVGIGWASMALVARHHSSSQGLQ